MAGDMVIGDQVTVFGNNRAAADGLHFHFPAFAIFRRDDMNAYQGRAHACDGGIDGRADISRNFLSLN